MTDVAPTPLDVDQALPGLDPPLDPIVHPSGDTPPKRRGRPPGAKTDPRKLEAARKLQGKPAATGPGRPSNNARTSAELVRQLAAGYEAVGAMTGAVIVFAYKLPPAAAGSLYRLAAVGAAMAANAEECATAVVAYSERNARLRTWLERSGQSASLIGVAIAHLPILLAAFGDTPAIAPAPPVDLAAMMGDPAAMAEAERMASTLFASMFPQAPAGGEE